MVGDLSTKSYLLSIASVSAMYSNIDTPNMYI